MSNIFYTIPLFWIFLDIFSKYLAQIYLVNRINIFWDFIYLQLVKNSGVAFGVQIPLFLLKIITIVLIIGIFYYYKQEKKNYKTDRWFDLAFWLILAGAIWNAYERIFLWEVTDFIWVQYFSVFNLADSFITLWVLLYFYIMYKKNNS